jgi:hypothetical protein
MPQVMPYLGSLLRRPMTEKSLDPTLPATACSGMLIGSFTEAFNEMAKELRTYAGSDFDDPSGLNCTGSYDAGVSS